MRWKAEKKYEPGDTKVIRRFLWEPKELDNEWRWFEKANIKCVAKDTSYTYKGCYHKSISWREIGWADKPARNGKQPNWFIKRILYLVL